MWKEDDGKKDASLKAVSSLCLRSSSILVILTDFMSPL